MGAGGQSTYSRMLTSDATRLASYINQLGEVTRLTSTAQEASYQAQALRANKAIYETENQLAQSSIQDQAYYGVKELQTKYAQAEADTQGNILTNIGQQRLTETKGANQLKTDELGREFGLKTDILNRDYALKEKDLAGYYNTQQRASELAMSAVQTTSSLKEKLYNIRRGVESSVGKITGDFAGRNITSKNAQAIIMSDLNDRAYRAEIASDETIALLGMGSSLLDQSVAEYKDTMQLGKQEMDAKNALGRTEVDAKNALGRDNYKLETAGQRSVLTQEIQNARTNLQLQLDLYNVNADSITNSAEHKAQESYYDSVVKTYQDEVQARLKEHQATTAEFMARQQLSAAKLGYASKTDASIIDIPG